MLDKITGQLQFQGNALLLRAERQRVIASNIANADTPGFTARELRFGDALRSMQAQQASGAARAAGVSDARHIPLPAAGGTGAGGQLSYAQQTQPSLDNNSVDMDRERAAFMDNAVRYEATLRFINSQAKTLLSAIQGQ